MFAFQTTSLACRAGWQHSSDTAGVDAFLRALTERSVALAFQAVRLVHGPGNRSFYFEALSRLNDGGQWRSCGEVIQAMERLDCIAWYDMLVLDAVIDLLGRHPGVCLACNVSARTLRTESGWQAIYERLQQNQTLASRLILEITETASLADSSEALSIIGRLRSHGCRVAIDDLGSGKTTLAFVRDCQPEIIKIDRSVLDPNPRLPHPSTGLLVTLVDLCVSLNSCAVIVAEGVDRADLLCRAIDVGVNAVQGNSIDPPRFRPAWLTDVVYLEISEARLADAFPMSQEVIQAHGDKGAAA